MAVNRASALRAMRSMQGWPSCDWLAWSGREVLRTTVLDAEPQGTVVLPAPSMSQNSFPLQRLF